MRVPRLAVRTAALFAYVPNCKLLLRRIGVTFIITVYLTASARRVPDARSQFPTSSSQALEPDLRTFSVSTSEFRRHHDLQHQSVLTTLCVWSVSAVYRTPCLCSVGFCNRSDTVSDTSFRGQSQRVLHLSAAFQMCFTERFHFCQGNRIFVRLHTCPSTCERSH